MPRPPGIPKTGGRSKGTPNRPKPITLEPTNENRELVALAQVMRTPKAVILEAMVRFETLGLGFLAKADKLMKTRAAHDKVAEIAQEGHKYIAAAVECATKAAPYVHARLLAIESRGDMTDDRAPFVLRAPMVLASSQEWQAMVSHQGAAMDRADRADRAEERWPGRPLVENNAPRASGDRMEGMPHPAMPSGSAETDVSPMPTPLRADPETGRIGPAEPTPTVAPSPRMMPVGPVVVKPSGSEEWLEAVARDRAKKVG
jgi:hypothetical protein